MLDLVESSPCEFQLANCVVGSARDEPTQAVMELTGDEATLADVEKRIRVRRAPSAAAPRAAC